MRADNSGELIGELIEERIWWLFAVIWKPSIFAPVFHREKKIGSLCLRMSFGFLIPLERSGFSPSLAYSEFGGKYHLESLRGLKASDQNFAWLSPVFALVGTCLKDHFRMFFWSGYFQKKTNLCFPFLWPHLAYRKVSSTISLPSPFELSIVHPSLCLRLSLPVPFLLDFSTTYLPFIRLSSSTVFPFCPVLLILFVTVAESFHLIQCTERDWRKKTQAFFCWLTPRSVWKSCFKSRDLEKRRINEG